LEKSLEGLKTMDKIPDVMFIIDPVEEATALAEARKLNIPVVAVCDTNCDPDLIDYPVPGNDDAIRAVKLFCSVIADAILEGKGIENKQEDVATEVQEEVKEEKSEKDEKAVEEKAEEVKGE